MSDNKEVEALGWDAIDKALYNIYGDVEPMHYGTVISYNLGGNDPLQGISVYSREEPIAHWHYITYGFSELYEKESEDLEYSGFGFELTFRLKKEENEDEAPKWPISLLQNLARYVFSSGNVFLSGHYIDANGPIALETDTLLKALIFTEDPELPAMDTPNGKVEFLQAIGITLDELEAIKCWNSTKIIEILGQTMPLYSTDLYRKTILENKDIRKSIKIGIEEDGSSTGSLFLANLTWIKKKKFLSGVTYEITIGAQHVDTFKEVLKGRITKHRDLFLSSKDCKMEFEFEEKLNIQEINEFDIKIFLNKEIVNDIYNNLKAKEGIYKLKTTKNIIFNVEKTKIKDRDGNVIEVIG